jgi:hypothetical protein
MARKKIFLKKDNNDMYFIFDPNSQVIEQHKEGFWNGGRVGEVGKAKNLTDAIEICKAVLGLNDAKIEITDA